MTLRPPTEVRLARRLALLLALSGALAGCASPSAPADVAPAADVSSGGADADASEATAPPPTPASPDAEATARVVRLEAEATTNGFGLSDDGRGLLIGGDTALFEIEDRANVTADAVLTLTWEPNTELSTRVRATFGDSADFAATSVADAAGESPLVIHIPLADLPPRCDPCFVNVWPGDKSFHHEQRVAVTLDLVYG